MTSEWAACLAHREVLSAAQVDELPDPEVLEKAGVTPELMASALADRGRGLRAAYVVGALGPWGGLQAVPFLLMEINAAAAAETIANGALATRAWQDLAQSHSVVQLAKAYGVSRQTIHKRMRRDPPPLSVIGAGLPVEPGGVSVVDGEVSEKETVR